MGGIAVAGTVLVDKINEISAYPKSGELTKIFRVHRSVGGCVPNVSIDLKTLSPETEIFAVGRIGKDEDGRFVQSELSARGVNTDGLKAVGDRTSFTEVMSVSGGERTFFTYAGASSGFGVGDIDFSAPHFEMLHLGYFLLLDKIDGGDGLKILKEAQSRGIKTSIDLVSENTEKYSAVLPCLKYTDNVIINEIEAGKLSGMEPKKENLRAIAEKIKSYGVRERVIIHLPEAGVCLSDGGFTFLPSLELKDGFIKGTTGAGDAFCAGALLEIYRKRSDGEILSFASMAAAAALSETDAVGGLKSEREIRKNFQNSERKKYAGKSERAVEEGAEE